MHLHIRPSGQVVVPTDCNKGPAIIEKHPPPIETSRAGRQTRYSLCIYLTQLVLRFFTKGGRIVHDRVSQRTTTTAKSNLQPYLRYDDTFGRRIVDFSHRSSSTIHNQRSSTAHEMRRRASLSRRWVPCSCAYSETISEGSPAGYQSGGR